MSVEPRGVCWRTCSRFPIHAVLRDDAIFCQREICRQIIDSGSDYLFVVKDNAAINCLRLANVANIAAACVCHYRFHGSVAVATVSVS